MRKDGHGAVYLVHLQADPSKVFFARATKVSEGDPARLAVLERTLRVIEALKRVKSPYVVQMVDYLVEEDSGSTLIFKHF